MAKQLDAIVEATRQARRPLRGQAEIALRVGKVVDEYRVAKHFRPDISNDHFSYKRDTDSIKEEAALDDLYVICTSVPAGEMAAEEAIRAYKDLSVVEQAFRCLKGVAPPTTTAWRSTCDPYCRSNTECTLSLPYFGFINADGRPLKPLISLWETRRMRK